MNKANRYIFLSMTVALAACSLPTKELVEFGKASEVAAETIRTPMALESRLLKEAAVNENSCRQLAGSSAYRLAAESKRNPSVLIAEQAKVATALERYASALTAAASGESIDQLKQAATAFNGAAGELLATAGAPATVGDGATAFTNLAIRLGEARRTKEIKAVMSDVMPSLILLPRALEDDAKTVDDTLADLIANWDKQARCVLRVSRRAGFSPRTTFVEFDKAKREILAAQRRAAEAASAANALKKAHVFALTADGSLDDALDVLNEHLSDLVAIKQAAASAGG